MIIFIKAAAGHNYLQHQLVPCFTVYTDRVGNRQLEIDSISVMLNLIVQFTILHFFRIVYTTLKCKVSQPICLT